VKTDIGVPPSIGEKPIRHGGSSATPRLCDRMPSCGRPARGRRGETRHGRPFRERDKTRAMTRPMEWTPERIARFWANESRTPGNYFTFQFGRRMAKAIAPHVRGCTDLLDYGAGPGFLVRHLARPGLRITAADTSPEAVEAARRNNAGVPGFRGAWLVEELRRSGETFGAVVAAETVEHIDDAG